MLDQGFRYYLNLVCSFCFAVLLVSPALIVYIIHRKCRLAAKRNEEIKRLLVLASEEAARAERETETSSYEFVRTTTVPDSVVGHFQCAVCYFPTTTRCARCKSVRYCSGKCQIIHWRQGHRENCHPSPASYQVINDESIPSLNPVNQDEYGYRGNYSDNENAQLVKPAEIIHEEPSFSKFIYAPKKLVESNDSAEIKFYTEPKRTDSDSSTSSFSAEFSSYVCTSESSDEISVSDSISSNDFEKYQPADVSRPTEVIVTRPTQNQSKPLSAELDGFVSSTDVSTASIKSNLIKPGGDESWTKPDLTKLGGSEGQIMYGSISSAASRRNESSCFDAKPLMASNDFWEGAFDSNWPRKKAHIDPSLAVPKKAGHTELSVSGSSLHSSLNVSGSTISSLHSHSGKKFPLPDSTHKADLEKNDVINRAILSNSINIEAGVVKKLSVDQESNSTKALKDNSISSMISKSSDHFVKDQSTSHPRKSKEYKTPSTASDSSLPSSNVDNLVSGVKTGIDGHAHANHMSSQTANTESISSNGFKAFAKKNIDQVKASQVLKSNSVEVSETAGRYSDKGLFPYDFFIKLYAWKVELLPCGLTNCGNSCYANVVFQCLAFTQPLSAYLLQGFHSKACANKEWCFTCEFENLISKFKEGIYPLSPSRILSQLRDTGTHLGHGREEDAHEFLRHIIDKMQSICLMEAEANVSGSMIEETTLVGLTFGGYLRSKIKCMKCKSNSERHERFMDLTVEIAGEIRTLEEALKKFTSTEILDGENKYHCSRCKSYEKAKKKLKILEAPNVLTIALKRFQSGRFGKLNKSIEFQEILDLAKYMSGTSDKSPIYKLYGVIVHLDVMNAAYSGHYVCYVKNNQNKWFKIDDSVVKPVELKTVQEKGAYMLFYARYSPRAPRLLRNTLTRDTKIKVALAKSGFLNATPTNAAQQHHNFIPLNNSNPKNSKSIYSNHQTRSIFRPDSSSDSSSLFSSCSDEGSCSTASIRGSPSTDDLLDYIFADSDSYAQGAPETSRSESGQTGSGLERKGSTKVLYSNLSKHCRNIASSISCSDSERLNRTNPFDDVVKYSSSSSSSSSSVSLMRKPSKERTS